MKKRKKSGGTPTVIGAFFDAPGQYDYPFDGEFYRTVYTQLEECIRKSGGKLLIVRSQDTYLGNNVFSGAWKFSGRDLVAVPGPVTIDVIWNKGHLNSSPGDRVVNDPALDALCTDKWLSYELVPDLHPKTFLLMSAADVPTALSGLGTAFAVAKPVDAEGGAGVIIGPKDQVAVSIPSFPYVLQEFVDTSHGIPGIVDGMHDFRILSIAGAVSLCYVRTPPPNEMTANVSRGGREIEVLAENVPAEALAVFTQVDAKLRGFKNRIYTVDMGLDHDGTWKLFELNAKPGFSPRETGPSYALFYQSLADFLLSLA